MMQQTFEKRLGKGGVGVWGKKSTFFLKVEFIFQNGRIAAKVISYIGLSTMPSL
jgi:hypothetical protein